MLSTGTAGDWFKKLIVTASALNVCSPCTRGADHFCSIFMIFMVFTIPVTSPDTSLADVPGTSRGW